MASRVVTRHYDRSLAAVGLRANDYSILARLDQDGSLPLGTLAARLAMDRTTLSRESAPLIAAGLLETRPGEHDARIRLLSLSDAGRARVLEARPLWARAQASLREEFGLARTSALIAELHALVGAGA
jgi:DNA-binding MarR family transcriptional regulator